MNRRDFSLHLTGLAGAAATGLLPQFARAQGVAPVEGQQYIKLPQPVPVSASGKVEVLEFFWYGCPHCNAFEPALEPWAHHLPDYIQFKRVHVAFDALKEFHQRLYYTIETMGLVEQLHTKVFARFHVEHRPINREADAVAFATANGVDGAKFSSVFNSFSVQTKMRQAKALSESYRLDGVPTMGIQGRYTTAPSMAGGHEQTLQVVNFLANQVHKGA